LLADVLGDPVTAQRRFAAAVERLLTEHPARRRSE